MSSLAEVAVVAQIKAKLLNFASVLFLLSFIFSRRADKVQSEVAEMKQQLEALNATRSTLPVRERGDINKARRKLLRQIDGASKRESRLRARATNLVSNCKARHCGV